MKSERGTSTRPVGSWALVIGAVGLAAALNANAGPPTPERFTFEHFHVVTGPAERQTVLTGFLLEGAIADLCVLHVDGNGDRRLRLHAFEDGSWVPALDATLQPGTLWVDVADIGDRERLLTYRAGRLSWFDPERKTERPLVEVDSSFDPPRRNEVPHVDVTRDVNGDRRDDLVVPDVDGFRVFVQLEDGSFADPVTIGLPAELSRIYGADGYRYDPWSQSRVHEMDYDHDGRGDLVFWNGDHFAAHLQDERGLFSPVARTFTTDVAFDSDRLDALLDGDLQGRVLHSLTDMNGDAIADMVIFSLEGERASSRRSTYEVHFGAATAEGGTVFARGVDRAFRSDRRVQLGMDRHDLDRDGGPDLMLTTIDVRFLTGSLWKRIKGFMGDDVWLDLEFYRMDAGRYRDAPDTVRRMALDGAPSHREPGWVPLEIVLRGATHEARRTQKRYLRAFNPTLLLGDVTGDGRPDLILEHTHRELHVFVGVAGPELFARHARTVKVPVPNDEEYTWLVDLDRDGRQDVLLHHPFTQRNVHGAPKHPPGTEPHRVTLLVAR